MRTREGLSTEAVFIFTNMLRKLLTTHSPDYIAAIFESSEPTFRSQEFTEYKANRPEPPADLTEQIPYVRRILEAMGVRILEYTGFEADDVIGTIATRAAESGADVTIVSSDKDMLQLVGDGISMLNPAKDDTWYDAMKVTEFMGVAPAQVPDLLALKGDTIDNIPGAPGIGDKGAVALIQQFGSVEAAIERAAEVAKRTYRESLQNSKEQILLSKRLATLDTRVPLDWRLEALAVCRPDTNALRDLYRKLEFFSLLKELPQAPESQLASAAHYTTLDTADGVQSYLDSITAADRIAVALASHGEGLLAEKVFGLAALADEGRAIPAQFLDQLRPLLENENVSKASLDVKSVIVSLLAAGVEARGFKDDPVLYAFLLDADPAGCSPEALVERRLGRKAGCSAEEMATLTLLLAETLAPQVEARGFRQLYETIDLPLVPVLARMERTGIRIDPSALADLSRRIDAELVEVTREIYKLAGRTFNISSPQQLSELLFNELGLPAPVRRGKGKVLSTAADVLEGLASEHEIVRHVLNHRQLVKLRGTYVEALPALIHPASGRLHTTFNPTGAATGRLSSYNPNLQNIPIRTELGREIRAAFVPRPGWSLMVADYSQIELRLLAHMSEDPVLLDAFRRGEDIHRRTAAEVFEVPPLLVTHEMRRNAKAVNFGIVYGLSPFGLAAQLGIPREEAARYIQTYFERYRGVRRFIDESIESVRKTGVTRTLFGRERPIPDIHSRNPNARGFAERTAVNTPLQGTAADVIKLAMIRIDSEITRRSLESRMLLQVHDELVFEAPPRECDLLSELVKHEMENVRSFAVPLLADVGAGPNWRDAK